MEATRTFDYVVVGAGTAGCVVACRLAAAGVNVALLEAGGPYRRVLDVPLLSPWAWLRAAGAVLLADRLNDAASGAQRAPGFLARRPAGGRQFSH